MYPHLSCGDILDFSTWQMWEILKLLYTWRNFKFIQNRDVFYALRFFVAPLFCRDLRAFAWRKISPKFYMWRKNDKYQVCWEQTPRLCHFKFFEERSWYKGLKWPQEVYGGVSLTLWDTCKRLWLWEGTPAGFILSSPHKKVAFKIVRNGFDLYMMVGGAGGSLALRRDPPAGCL